MAFVTEEAGSFPQRRGDPVGSADAEFWLRESQRAARLGTYQLDIASGVWRCTETLDDIFGIERTYPRSVESWAALVHPDDREGMTRYFREDVLGKGLPFEKEYRIVRPSDGKDRWVFGRGELILNDDGDPVTMLGTIQDVTERAEVERALREEEVRFKALFESAADAIVVVSEDGKIRMANTQAVNQFGYSLDELLGAPLDILIPEDVRSAHQGLETSFMSEPARHRSMGSNIHLRALRRDGSEFPALISLSQVETASGTYAMAAVVDITERERVQAELRENLDLLRKADATRRDLLSRLVDAQEEERKRIADDIHDDSIQIMAAVAMRLSALGKMVEAPEAVETFKKLEETVDLAVGRLRHLVFDLRPRVLDELGLAAALRASLEGLKGPARYSVEDRLSREPPPDTRAAMFRIALESIANVRKHAGASRVDVEIEDADGGFLLRIADDGEGFDTGLPHAGGMGLAAMKERAELASGWWKVRSAPGAGTTVEFWLPERPTRD